MEASVWLRASLPVGTTLPATRPLLWAEGALSWPLALAHGPARLGCWGVRRDTGPWRWQGAAGITSSPSPS